MVRVLLVEDESVILKSMTRILEGKGLVVLAAANAPDAIKLYAEHKPPYAILDLHLPGGRTGLDVLEAVKKINSNVKAYLITAEEADYFKGRAEKLGLTGFIPKPLDVEKLRKLADSFLEDEKL